MTEEAMTDREIHHVLDAVSHDPATVHPHRDDLRRAVVAEFRAESVSRRGEASANVLTLPDLIEAESTAAEADRQTLGRVRVLAAIAASLVFLVAVFTWTPSGERAETETAATPTLVGAAEPGTPLGTGRYAADDIAPGLRVTVGDDIVVADAGSGFVELRPADDAWGSSLFVMTAEGSLEALLEAYRADGLITMLRSAASADAGLATEFEVRPTADARGDACRQDPDCLTLGSTRLDVDGVNLAREITYPNGEVIWTLFRSDTVYAPFQRVAGEIVAALTFDDA